MVQNYLDRDIDHDLDHYLDCDPEDAPVKVYTGHSLFNITNSIKIVLFVQPLFDDPEIAIHPIYEFKLSIVCLIIIVNIVFSGYFKYYFTYDHFFFTVRFPCHAALPDPKSS